MTRIRRVVVGVDIGGTGIRFVAMADGAVVAESTRLTAVLGAGAPEARIARMAAAIRGLAVAGDVRGEVAGGVAAVGIGATGPVDNATGEIHNQPTLPAFSDIGLVSALADRLGCSVRIDNDAVAAALGERAAGAGRGSPRLLMITLGTGVGGALLVDGVPWRGGRGEHPEIGHLPVFGTGPACYCGLAGCWEPQASRAALQEALTEHVGDHVPARDVLPAAAAQFSENEAVRRCFHRYGERIGRGIACLQVVYGPTTTVIGGGAAAYFSLFESGVRTALTQRADYTPASSVVAAELGERAGAIGACVLANMPVSEIA